MNMNLPSAIQALEPSRSPFYKLREGPDFFRVPVEVIGITNFTSSIKKNPEPQLDSGKIRGPRSRPMQKDDENADKRE